MQVTYGLIHRNMGNCNGCQRSLSFLEAEDNLLLYFRKGEHEHTVEDVEKLVSVIRNRMCGEPVAKGAFVLPFKKQRLIYHWKCPRNI